MVPRVLLTEKAAELIARLKAQHGPLMFHQSGGCCDGSTPMCFAAGEFRVGAQDDGRSRRVQFLYRRKPNIGGIRSSSSMSCRDAARVLCWKRPRAQPRRWHKLPGLRFSQRDGLRLDRRCGEGSAIGTSRRPGWSAAMTISDSHVIAQKIVARMRLNSPCRV